MIHTIDKLLAMAPVMAGRVTRDAVLSYGNDVLARRIGKSSQEIAGRPLAEVIRPEALPPLLNALEQVFGGKTVQYVTEPVFPDLGKRHVQVMLQPFSNGAGEIEGAVFFAVDDTDVMLGRLHEVELRQIFSALDRHAIVSVTDVHGNIKSVNDKFCEISGYSREELMGQNHRLLKSAAHAPEMYEQLWATIASGNVWQGELCNRAKDGSPYWVFSTIVPFLDESGLPSQYISIRTDVTPIKMAEARSRQLAYFDPLTHLPNRRLLMERLGQLVGRCAEAPCQAAALLIDIDEFKKINDLYGHSLGDSILREVGRRLREIERDGDTVAHLGGDEFMVLFSHLGETSEECSRKLGFLLSKVMDTLRRPHQVTFDQGRGALEVQSRPSIGVCLVDGTVSAPDEVLRRTDLALTHAKASGKNRVAYYDLSLEENLTQRFQLERELEQAIERQELMLYFQPVVDEEQRTEGYEALIRWQHPERGLVSPATFIPIAEQTKLIVPIGWWVMREACQQLVRWQQSDQTRALWVSVNVSARQLKEAHFVADLQAVLVETGAPADQLCIEITETVLLDDIGDVLVKKFEDICALGIHLALDDFGAGYSSFSYLKSLPLTKVKIDQSFVRSLIDSPKDQAITEAILLLADKLGVAVVAEGVETLHQFDMLHRMGCRRFQGYYFGRPARLPDPPEPSSH